MSDDRECTCHPDEAPVPCQKKYAFTECENERLREENARLRGLLDEAFVNLITRVKAATQEPGR